MHVKSEGMSVVFRLDAAQTRSVLSTAGTISICWVHLRLCNSVWYFYLCQVFAPPMGLHKDCVAVLDHLTVYSAFEVFVGLLRFRSFLAPPQDDFAVT